MISDETELEMVRRHVRRGLILVTRQRATLDRLRQANHPTQLAEAVLLSIQSVQAEHEAHLRRITPLGRPDLP
jgi:hypothetical protein